MLDLLTLKIVERQAYKNRPELGNGWFLEIYINSISLADTANNWLKEHRNEYVEPVYYKDFRYPVGYDPSKNVTDPTVHDFVLVSKLTEPTDIKWYQEQFLTNSDDVVPPTLLKCAECREDSDTSLFCKITVLEDLVKWTDFYSPEYDTQPNWEFTFDIKVYIAEVTNARP